MTRKDYILIATALKKALSETEKFSVNAQKVNGVKTAAWYLADALEKDNPRFDRERFMLAAVVQS